MKPEPLNLDIQFKANLTYKWGNEYDFINFKKGYEKGFSEAQKVILKIVKQRIKSACEFYLRYKDRAKKFITDFPEYAENIVLIVDVYTDGKQMADYNDWLFKLAFKDVFEDDKGD